MSPRAAWRLESLGFNQVMDFVPGKTAWYQENEPRQGKAEAEIWIGDVVDSEVPTCRLSDRIGDVSVRVRAAGWETCVVLNDERIVLGLLRKQALDSDPTATAESVMRSGPATFRPNLTLEQLLSSMRENDIKTNSLVTTSEGRLLGVISRDDAEATSAHQGDSE